MGKGNSQVLQQVLISEAVVSRSRLEHEEGIALTATSAKGNKIEIVSMISTDPDGDSPIGDRPQRGDCRYSDC
jgi:hypothetical protein